MNLKQAKKLRAIVYGKDFSYRHRHYMWDIAPKIVKENGVDVLKTGSIQADSKRKLYKKTKEFFKQGTSLEQIKLLVAEVQS